MNAASPSPPPGKNGTSCKFCIFTGLSPVGNRGKTSPKLMFLPEKGQAFNSLITKKWRKFKEQNKFSEKTDDKCEDTFFLIEQSVRH